MLHQFLRQLGAEGPLPAEPADAAERYRGMLEGRRVLIVLDHASSYAQVRHLLPTSGGCCVLITGRANLDELMQKYRALRLRVAPLSDDESRETLTSVLRDARAEDSPRRPAASPRCAGTPRWRCGPPRPGCSPRRTGGSSIWSAGWSARATGWRNSASVTTRCAPGWTAACGTWIPGWPPPTGS